MSANILDSEVKFEIKERKLLLKEDGSYNEIGNIEKLKEILNGSKSVDVIFKLDPESMLCEMETKTQTTEKKEYPLFAILLLHEFSEIRLNIEGKTFFLRNKKSFKEEKEILELINNAYCAWASVELLYPLGSLIDYFVDSEIFVKDRLENEDLVNDFKTRVEECKIMIEKFREESGASKYLELAAFIENRIKEEVLDFFDEIY